MLWFRISVIGAVMLASVASVSATVVIPASFEEMVDGSEMVVHGTVRTVRGQSTAGRQSIETVVTVDVTATIKWQLAATVTFRVPGGEVGRYRVVLRAVTADGRASRARTLGFRRRAQAMA